MEMKLAFGVSVIILLCVHVRPSHSAAVHQRLKRGFKDNIAMGHGFGKRTESASDLSAMQSFLSQKRRMVSNQELSALMRKTPGLSLAIVAKFVDKNGDGYVSGRELFPNGRDE